MLQSYDNNASSAAAGDSDSYFQFNSGSNGAMQVSFLADAATLLLGIIVLRSSKKRGLSLEEKREKMLQIFYDSQDFYLNSLLENLVHKFVSGDSCAFKCLNRQGDSNGRHVLRKSVVIDNGNVFIHNGKSCRSETSIVSKHNRIESMIWVEAF
ncbi:hypothetical protein Tco_0010171 [Tanacetum coccineum]